MPSFRRRASVIDADSDEKPVEEPSKQPEDAAKALALAEEAEAEAAEAEAVAAAARAKARAIRLRREAEAAGSKEPVEVPEDAAVTETDPGTDLEADDDSESAAAGDDEAAADETVAVEAEPEAMSARASWLRRIKWKLVAAGVAILCTAGLIAVSVLMVINHRNQAAEQQQRAEYEAAARQGVVTLMSLDFNKAKDDVQRIIDNTTGQFKQDFEASAEAFAQVAQDSKVVTEVTVNAVAIKAMTDDTAQALVSATSRITNAQGAKQDPRPWRLQVELAKEGDQIKMSKVEFVL